MKTINNLLNSNAYNRTVATTSDETHTNALECDAKIVNTLFDSLLMIHTAWRQMWPDLDCQDKRKKALGKLKAQWMKAFTENGINTPEQLEFGLRKSRAKQNPFFPAVGEFIAWCQPSHADLGMFNPHAAWLECCNNSHRKTAHKWSHPGVHEAGSRTGWFDIRQGEASEDLFASNYADVLLEVSRGAVFELPVMASNMLEQQTSGNKTNTEKAKVARDLAMKELRGD